jgi:uncharacterized membrane protein YhaH (DUF805 family)
MPSDQYQVAGASIATIVAISSIISLVVLVFAVIVYWKIFSKAGYSGAMGLLMFVPIANIIALCILAFGNWPIHEELNMLRQRVGASQYPQGPQNPQYSQYPQGPQNPQYPQGPQNPQYPR